MLKLYYAGLIKNAVEVPLESVHPDDWKANCYYYLAESLDKMRNGEFETMFVTYDDYLGWLTAQERATAWGEKNITVIAGCQIDDEELEQVMGGPSPQTKDHINPSHYQGYIQDLQWLEAMQYIPHLRDQNTFLAAVELQFRKYLDRSGGKDEELQESKKALWYMKFYVARLIAGHPIRVNEINKLIGDMGQGGLVDGIFVKLFAWLMLESKGELINEIVKSDYFTDEEKDHFGLMC
jgi:hypothetical protein